MRGVEINDMSSTCPPVDHPRPFGGYPINEPPSPSPACPYNSITPKQEPMNLKEKIDSGISGSDSHSSSPDSTSTSMRHAYCPTTPMDQQFNTIVASLDDILTPPNSEPMTLAKNLQSVTATCSNTEDEIRVNDMSQTTTITACTSPSNASDIDDAVKQPQIAVEDNKFLPPLISPNFSESSGDNTLDMDIVDGEEIYVPKYNLHGKIKELKCKQCSLVFITKADLWKHIKGHIRSDKMLSCPKCPFVTELKHHFKFHILNHTGNKPYKCHKCDYSCVNKSMLNSHLKSHSSVYQYGCADCPYVTKYCHSLKIHLRKEGHKPSIVLNPDGTPNPLPVIDVYGSRRGPNVKVQKQRTVQESSQQLPFQFNPLTPQAQIPFPYIPSVAEFPSAMAHLLFLQNLPTLLGQYQEYLRENQNSLNAVENNKIQREHIQAETEVLDLSKRPEQPFYPQRPVKKNRRKGPAYKLVPADGNTSDEDDFNAIFNNNKVIEHLPSAPSMNKENHGENKTS